MSDQIKIEDWYDEELKKFLKDLQDGAPSPKTQQEAAIARHNRAFIGQLYMARRQAHLTQLQLAQKADMPQSSLARIESGRANPSLKTLLRLAQALEIELNLLKLSKT